MSFQPGAVVYTQSFGSRAEGVEVPTIQPRAPSTTDSNWPIGKEWIDKVGLNAYILVGLSSVGGVLSATWIQSGSGATFSAPAITASTGNVTATNGNLVASGVGSGLVLTPTVVTAGASPQVVNGRVGSVTFSGVSIAAAATQTFTITNSAVTGAGTLLLLTMSGATTGSALTIASIVNSAGSSAITVTNGTGATTDVANITFTFEVLN